MPTWIHDPDRVTEKWQKENFTIKGLYARQSPGKNHSEGSPAQIVSGWTSHTNTSRIDCHIRSVDCTLRSNANPKKEKRRDTPCIHYWDVLQQKPEHIMGIDGNSRDLFSRVIFGSRLSLQIGLSTISFAILLGV